MKQILKYLKEYKKECICAPLFKLLEASFELIVPLVMAAIIDNGIAASDKPYIWKMGGVLVLLAAVGLVSSVTAQYFAAKAAVGFSTKLRHILFEKIESLSFSKMDTVGTSTLITRMTSDINQVQSGVNLVLRLFLRSPFIVFGAMAMAFTVNVRAAMVFVVTIPLLSIVVFSVMAASLPLYKKVQSSLDTVLSHTKENLEGTRVIRAFNKQNDEIDSFNSDNELLTNMQQVVGRISALTNPLTFIIINIATIAVIVSGGKQVYAGILTQGEVVALVNYMSQILVELIKLANLIVQVTKAVACGNRIADVLSIPSKLPDKNPKLIDAKAGAPEVEFDHVCMTYEGAADETLTDISFTVQKGQTIGIIGGTGSGKSSLVNLIPRFYDATKGTIRIQGNDINDYDAVQLRDKIGVVMQKAVLFAGTIADNLRWGNPNATDAEIVDACKQACADEFIERFPDKYQTHIEQGGNNVSGGQKQRLCIARALLKKPRILILDDSTSAVDTATDARIRRSFAEKIPGTTVFIVAQRISSVENADKVLVLDNGRVSGFDTPANLLKTNAIYQDVYNSQTKGSGDFDEKGGEA